jgi:protein AroM
MPGDAGVVFPSRILAGLAAALLPHGRLGLLVPALEQIKKLSKKWERPGVEIAAEALIPSASAAEAEEAGRRLAASHPDLVAMDCMSHTPQTRAALRRVVKAPTLLAVSATARVLQELLA